MVKGDETSSCQLGTTIQTNTCQQDFIPTLAVYVMLLAACIKGSQSKVAIGLYGGTELTQLLVSSLFIVTIPILPFKFLIFYVYFVCLVSSIQLANNLFRCVLGTEMLQMQT